MTGFSRGAAIGFAALVLLPAPAGRPDAQTVALTPVHGVYTLGPGARTTVGLTAATSDGRPLAAPASVGYGATSITFPAGTPSGTVRRFTVRAPADRTPST